MPIGKLTKVALSDENSERVSALMSRIIRIVQLACLLALVLSKAPQSLAAGTLRAEHTFDGRRLKYQVDAAGRTTRVENGAMGVTELAYDAVGQLLSRAMDDGSSETFAYSVLGDLTEATNASDVFRFERDAVGRIIREAQTVDGVEHWVALSLDAEGERVGRTTSLGHEEHVTRDALGARTVTLLDQQHEVRHVTDSLGRETARALPGGGRIETGFDALGRLARRRALDRTALGAAGGVGGSGGSGGPVNGPAAT